ncbi:2-C-methyl-D-erythritol 4-phosphate cytidylyltransferase [Dyadobacter sp. CY356]|uniref:2-C-methyl-D-erythritol 4-phosphate cytidylyltransferase n=1 Tax=Dyadobacter sp. CY356 TaxID=2906442 RepID=UPI001F2DCF91|nr:2-C-methyl-D-erythritol 4-phosphate cytidylyltransferase [Dyadobacter sp. CY356]MCF0058523.1 2-C-methyl-D-erythritol 4-phosphate cytidylyltransferase [Dyadobacter sp. CY356]
MQEYVIIVAGGSGSRMRSDIPKQFIPVNGLPVLMHTMKAFRSYSDILKMILVLPEAQFDYWNQLCHEFSFTETYSLVQGGETRFQSVKNGLDSIKDNEHAFVAVHDGVRPVISRAIIFESFQKATQFGTAVASVALKDSIRIVESSEKNTAMDRSAFRLIQTPQTFRIDWMKKAFNNPYQPLFTDCASVLEFEGYPIHLTEGSYENIKITTPDDLRWAEIYLNS